MKFFTIIIFLVITTTANAQTGNVGIGVSNPQARLHAAGSIRFDTLAGSGTRFIQTDADGRIFTPVQYVNKTVSAIPDRSCPGLTSIITIADQPAVVDMKKLRVTIDITHPGHGELSIFLTAPNGNVVMLAKPMYEQNFDNTVFWDGAREGIEDAPTPYRGRFKPYGVTSSTVCNVTGTAKAFFSLGEFSPNGQWKLTVIDVNPGVTGTLNHWAISFDDTDPGFNNLDVFGEVKALSVASPYTGASNMLPVAYGVVYSSAVISITSSSGNCTLSKLSTGIYVITFKSSNLSNENLGNLPVIVSLYGGTPGLVSYYGNTGTITVTTFNAAGIPTDRGFTFMVMKP